MWQFLESIENSGLATWVRESPTVLGYSTVLALHTFGMAFLVGLSGAIALRVLGVFPELPLKPLERFFPLIVIGFWLNAVTGVVLTTLSLRSLAVNVDFYIKLIAIAFAIVGLRRLKHYAFDDGSGVGTEPSPAKAKVWAAAMLTFWGIAVLAGRLTAYTDSVRWQTLVAVVITLVMLLGARHVVLRVATSIRARSPRSSPALPRAHTTTSTNY
jgi:hypothetical protein